ncbi:MAG: response regulator [Clostridiales Family XIII bacterium]|jgi:signal transduction histidine kinase/DNA-binding response OmpR family regulator/predicted membrane protein|nr:response regulator [Clostridiales Family XIII bacterium]
MKYLKKIIDAYVFSENIPLEARKINVVYLIGLFGASAVLILRIIIGSDIGLIALIAFLILCIITLFYLSNRFLWHKVLTWVTAVVICDILFPGAFFFLGGINSAVTAYFVLSTVVIFLLISGWGLFIMLFIQLILTGLCYYLGEMYPQLLSPLHPEQRPFDHYFSYVILAICIGAIIIFQGHVFMHEQRKAKRFNQMLSVANESAETLLASDLIDLEASLSIAMGIIGRNLEIDRMYLWRNHDKGDQPIYYQEYNWEISDHYHAISLQTKTGHAYIDRLPVWEEHFQNDQPINGPVSTLSEEEQILLSAFGIQSILVVPVYLQNAFWGFVSFDDCHNDKRYFSADEIRILRSASLMLASTVVHYQDEMRLNAQLQQQKLMSVVSQSFLSKRPMDELITDALRMVGEFMDVSRVLIAKTNETGTAILPIYSWMSDDKWRPAPATAENIVAGIHELSGTVFPPSLSSAKEIEGIFCEDILIDFGGRYRSFTALNLKAFIWVPIYVENQFWGLISVEECLNSRVWTDSEAVLVTSISSAIAGAISRGQMEKHRGEALEQALQASKAKGDFLSNMSHEMRTPMNAIIGMTSIGKASDQLERKDYAFDKIEDASSHLLGVINDILDMSKIEANKLELSDATFGFETMLRKVVNVINFRMEERHQNFQVSIDRRIPYVLVGDDQRLAQVITNLLSNAIKFTPEEGSIRLNAVLIEETDGDCTLQVNVSDSGIGISKEQQSRIFRSFEQAERGTQRQFGGTGLGLAISKRIVELMGGTIWIESELGCGATFSFTVKMKRGEQSQSSLLRPDAGWNNLRLLVVDDDPEILDFFVDLCERFHIACDVEDSGEKALNRIENGAFYDIYFIDWRMPGMDGLKLSRKISERGGKQSVITMISATEWSTIEKEAREAGVKKYLSKPLFPSAISELINECIGKDHLKESPANRNDTSPLFPGVHILLAEDIPLNQEIVLALLEPTKLIIDVADNGRIAVEKFKADPERYALVFMDVQMPEMDGLEATRQIRAHDHPRAKTIPIVAMTANVFRENVETCLEAGMDAHVSKPIDCKEVLDKLQKYLAHE